jgi:hypothetical protein
MDPDPTPSFSDFKNAKKKFSSYFLVAGTFFAKIFILKALLHYFSLLITFMRKGKAPEPDSELDPDPYLSLMNPDPEGPKTCGTGSGSGSPTLLRSVFQNSCLSWSTVYRIIIFLSTDTDPAYYPIVDPKRVQGSMPRQIRIRFSVAATH